MAPPEGIKSEPYETPEERRARWAAEDVEFDKADAAYRARLAQEEEEKRRRETENQLRHLPTAGRPN